VALTVRVAGSPTLRDFELGSVARIGRGPGNDVTVGDLQVDGAWTVSGHHVEIHWVSGRWTTTNVSSRPGLLHVYEPGWEDMVLEPGRSWAPTRHRWSYGLGRPGHLFQVVCSTDDHCHPDEPTGLHQDGETASTGEDRRSDEDSTVMLPTFTGPVFTPLEQAVLLAYYGDFARLPRPSILEPASHRQAARRLGRSTDSARKAIERINEKIARAEAAPSAATGRHLSAEIGRWLARAGALDAVGRPAEVTVQSAPDPFGSTARP
jgi:hypothetical protein